MALASVDPKPTSIGVSALIGITVATVVVFLAGFFMTLAGGEPMVDALAIGGFAALWGGPGFGGMIAGIHWITRNPDQH